MTCFGMLSAGILELQNQEKLMTCFGMLSAGILELQNPSVFVEGFLGPQL